MDLDLKHLAKHLTDLPPKPYDPGVEVSDYVMAHIFAPLRRNEDIRFENLDFDLFDETDLDDLDDLMEQYYSHTCKLTNLNTIFCKTPPASVGVQRFC